jgi:hypothetical protein
MAIGFTAELSHYTSAGRYAIQATIPAPSAHDSPALAAATPRIAGHDSPGSVAGPAGAANPCIGVVCPAGKHCMVWPGLSPGTFVARCVEGTISCPVGSIPCPGYDGTHYCADLETDPNNCGDCETVCPTGANCVNGSCKCPAPSTLASNHNYVYWNNCEPIGGTGEKGWLTVSFVPDHLALPAGWSCLSDKSENQAACPTPSCKNPVSVGGHTGCCPVTGGFTVQLNAFPQSGVEFDFMQFVLAYGGPVFGNQVVPQVQYWDSNGNEVVNLQGSSLGSVASTLNETLSIKLNTDSNGNVVSADFQMGSNTKVPVPIPQTETVKISGVTKTVKTQVPIYAFEVDVVGPDDCRFAEFTTGSAALNYSASSGQLCLQSGIPSCAQGNGTAETSNLTYNTIGPPCCGSTITGQNVKP